ncbi:cysteine-rich CWC family protein [Vibrio sp. ES.051]|uniref:cysteine-rich CWC family protein n=1 Tax=Vibrio sp. ES.051 TaxID=1761909 RepID=UPI000BF74BBC|nr:cysteine-rich CWC family protein [Vibrio sp. ES.051]
MKSPCLAACKNSGGICSGCHRTMDEIIQWKDKTDEQRENIIDQITGINATHHCPECRTQAYCDIAAGKETCWCFTIETRDLPKPNSTQLCLCRKCLEKKPIL